VKPLYRAGGPAHWAGWPKDTRSFAQAAPSRKARPDAEASSGRGFLFAALTRPALRLGRATLALVCLATLFLSLAWAGDEKPRPELRTVEVYVPYDEFLKLTGKERDATVMSLEEYRTLVELALARGAAQKETELPPVKCALAEAVYSGVAQDAVVRMDVAFKVAVASQEWVRCDLGPVLPGLGRVTLDKEPGWVVTDNGRAYLLLKGAGAHTGTLSFSLAPQKEEDVQKIAGPLLNAASAVLRLEVSGRAVAEGASGTAFQAVKGHGQDARATAQPYPLDTVYDEARNSTRFAVALGRSDKLAFAWRRKHDAQKNEALLLAEHRISYLLERASPTFVWKARVTAARRKVDELFLIEPPGCRVVRLTGPDVNSWNRVGDSLRVLLERPLLGDTEFQAEGLLSAAPGNYELGCPALKDAREDTRYLALFEAPGARAAVGQLAGMRELALNEAAMPQLAGGRLSHVYLVEQRDAKLAVSVTAQPEVFDTQAVLTVAIGEKQVSMRALVAVQPEQGRVYAVLLNLPPPWTLDATELRERGTNRGLKAEMSREGENEAWAVALNEAADASHPLEFSALLKLRDPAWGEAGWEKRAFNFGTPAVAGARRSEVYLGISVHPDVDIAFGASPAWRTETAGKLERLGVGEAMLRAGLVTETPGSEVRLELTRKTPRGDYDLVTHVLTLEREAWVRSDVRFAVVDRAIEELLLNLPPEAKDPLYIAGPGIKEVVAGTEPGQRLVRFNQPWQGVRMLRIEYRAPLAADKDVPVPDIRLAGSFDSRRRVVFQSAGVVELKVEKGPGLREAALEDTPEFARPFGTGRALFAFTFDLAGAPGTYRTHLLARSPTLSSVAGELELKTVLDPSGETRTHAVLPRLYARKELLSLKLPEKARLVALCVDDQNVRPVHGAEQGVIRVPLPPRSNSRVELAYECSHAALGLSGAWEEAAPELLDIPVGVTNWQVYYPPEYFVSLRDGNVDPETPAPPQFFALSFWRNILHGRWPRWTAWETPEPPVPVRLQFAQRTEHAAAQQEEQVKKVQAQQLVAQEVAERAEAAKGARLGSGAIPEGALLKVGKLGGSARAALAYCGGAYFRFASRTVFLIAVLIGLWLARRPSKGALLRYVVWGLVLGTVLPPALDWQSPLLAVPFCEGLSLVGLLVLVVLACRGLKTAWQRRRARRASATGAAAAALLFAVLASFVAGSASAGESDQVLIPYPKDQVPLTDPPAKQTKVYVPKSLFLDLTARAHPEDQPKADDTPNMENRKNVALASAGATASGGSNPERLIDGQTNAYASALWQKEQQFVVTLPKAQQVDRVRILLWPTPERFSRYKLEVSSEGTTFITVSDRTQGYQHGWQTAAFAHQEVKAVRLTGTFDSGSDGCFNVAEVEILTPPTPIPLALGNAAYEMTVAEKTYRCTGTLEVAVFEPKGWVSVPLDFGPSQLVSLAIDGQPAKWGQGPIAGGPQPQGKTVDMKSGAVPNLPFVQLQGAGKHKFEMELEGPLALSTGRAQLQAKFVGGPATRLAVILPANVELDTKSLPSGTWIEKDAAGKTQRCEIDLGGSAGEVRLAWQSPDIRGKGASQIAARGYMQLQLGADGYGVFNADRITIDGSGVDQLSYKVAGDWDISSVTAPDLAEWAVAGVGENRRLRLWFQKPANQVLVQTNGWAPLREEESQVAVLVLENATRQEGFIGLQHGQGRRFTARSLESLKRASSQELAAVFNLPAASLPDRIYRWLEPPLKHTVGAELEPGQVALETQIVGVIKPERLLACVRTRYTTATGRTPLRHEVELPAGWDVRTCRSNAMRTWEILERGGTKRLAVYFTAHAETGTEIIWSAEAPLALPPDKALALELPQPRALGDAKTTETMDWVLASEQSLALSQGAATTMQGLPLERAPSWVRLEAKEEYQFAYRSLKPGSRLAIEVSKRGSLVYATVVSIVRAAEDHVQVNARCRFRIEQAGLDRFALRLPTGAQLVSLAARNLRGRETSERPDGLLVTAILQSPVSGEQLIDLAYRLPRAAGQDVVVGPVAIEGREIQQVEHYVGVLQIERGLVVVATKKGLNKPLQTEELPFVPDKVSSAALTGVFVAERDWSLTLRQPDLKVESGPAAEVALAVIKTIIAADGGVRSSATYTVRNRALQFLPVEMPHDAAPWGVLVDGQPVTVSHREDDSHVLLIPIQRMGLADLPIEVTLVYESARLKLPAAIRTYTPQAPKVLIEQPVVETYWQVYVPEEYEASRSGGTVKDVAGSVLVGGKVKSNIEDVERLMKIADSAESPAQRRKALRNVVRKRQELDDNAAVLQNVGQVELPEELKRIGREELRAQNMGNEEVQQQAVQWKEKLGKRQQDLDEAVASAADTEQQQAFLDNYNFLDNRWRGGARYKERAAGAGRPERGEVPLAALRESRPFSGFKKGELPPPPAARVTQQPAPLPIEGGLREETERRLNLEVGATDLHVPEKGKLLTFRRVEGYPELTLSLRSVSASWRYLAVGVLALMAIGLVVAARGRRGRSASLRG